MAQLTITGQVLDSATREPLVNASVFCQNTTLGTTTGKEGRFALQLKSGGYDLIFSYTGYQTQTVRITDARDTVILLVKEDKSLGEVVIRNSFEVTDGLAKYGDFFRDYFLGGTTTAARCRILNTEALKFFFYKRTNRLKVMATEPLLIENPVLGYQLRYQLDSFVYYYNTNSSLYRGFCLFTELEGTDSLRREWKAARKQAYEGSLLHFMHSYYDSSLQEAGWIVDLLDEKNDRNFVKINPYDSAYYSPPDSTGQIEFWFPRKISITYTPKRPEKEYLKKMKLPANVQYLISYVELKDAIAVMENGYFYEQKDWINQGYWTWRNVGDLLPYDYMPD